jgi:hypothetical protein
MTPSTVHLIAQELRNRRDYLTALEKWARSLEPGQAKMDVFQLVNFWRRVYQQVEKDIAAGRTHAPLGQGQG